MRFDISIINCDIMTKKDSELNSINLLLKNSSIIEKDNIKEYPHHLISLDSEKLAFIGTAQVKVYVEETENLYYNITEISDSFSEKAFKQYLFHDFIPILKKEKRYAVEKDLTLFVEHFKKQKVENYKISREIHGVSFEKDTVYLGSFSLINSSAHKQTLNKFKDFSEDSEIPNFLIEIDIKAKDVDKATEIGNLKFEQFENILAFMLSDLSRRKNIKILNNLDTSSQQIFVTTKSKVQHQQKKNYSFIIDLGDNYFVDAENGNGNIWELFSKEKTTDLEKRIKNAIEWTGKALKDDNKSKVLIQFMFAIECALHIQPKKSIINASILSLISDNIAFLLYDDYDKRKMISSTFKDLYQKRSDIVHGSNHNVKFQDLNKALHLCKLIVKKLLTEEPYSSFADAQKLGEYLTYQKFK